MTCVVLLLLTVSGTPAEVCVPVAEMVATLVPGAYGISDMGFGPFSVATDATGCPLLVGILGTGVGLVD